MRLFSHLNILSFFILYMFLAISMPAHAQERDISGLVTDEAGTPLVGANVLVKGTTKGALTDIDGKFAIKLSPEDQILRISYISYETKEVSTENESNFTIQLVSKLDLEEVVITALGVEREEKALGYSVQQIEGEEISQAQTTNLVNGLAGKVAGVYITGSAAGPTASANINIRGAASLLGNNQPLFVVNGMPITNDLFSFDDGLNGSTTIDFGNAAQIIAPNDVESINVLKGPAASALYGSRAADGVILVETKTGEGAQGWGVELNSQLTFQDILKLPDYQDEFGFGGGGKYSYLDGTNYIGANEYYEAYGENWGPRLNGQLIKQFDSNGQPAPYTASPDNIRNFFRTGIVNINNLALTHYAPESDVRFSYTNFNNRGIVPNTDLGRNTFYTSVGKRMFDNRLKARVNAMYVNSNSGNVPNAGYDESSSIMYGWLWYPRQVSTDALKDYWQPGREGIQQRYVENLWVNNPWLIVNENTNSFQSNRLIGTFQLTYDLTPQISARFRYGADVVNEGRQYRRAPSTKGVLQGSYREDEISFSETNAELLIGYNSDRTKDFSFDVKLGGNIMRQNANFLVANNPQLKFFGTDASIYTLTNSRSGVLVESQKTETGINSLFGIATFAYKGLLYLDATYRHDWNSTLVNPLVGLDNSNFDFGYPSVSFSAIISEMLETPPDANLSFLKVKAAYAEVGNGAPPYAFGNTFTPQASFGSNSVFTTNGTIATSDLRNERTRAFETGFDLRMFLDRVRLDATYYDMLSFDQVIFLPVATVSGYDFNLTNGGEIRNRGIEVLLSGTPIYKENFSWDVTLNLGHNRAVVEKLPDVIESGRYSIVADIFPGDEGGSDLEYVAEEGELLGQLYGLGFERGPDGRIIHVDGLPLNTQNKVSAGSYQPDLRLGLYNTFRVKNISFGFLFDGQIGGKIYSRSHALYNTGGAITNNDDPNLNLSTLDGRTIYSVSYGADGEPVYSLEQEGGVVGPGWKWVDANEDGQIGSNELSENDVVVPAGGAGYTGYFYNYYGNGFNRDNIESATYDATYFKLREVSLGYTFDNAKIQGLGLQGLQVSLIGRNLLLFSDVPSIDPETYSIRNGLFVNGFESTQLPSTRSYGVTVKARF